MLYEVPSPPKFRRPPEDEEPTPSVEKLEHRKPPLPESSISRIFYKAGPLGPTYRPVSVKQERAFWVTREIAMTMFDMERRVQSNFAELLIYSCFVLMLTYAAFGYQSKASYQITRAFRRQFIDREFKSEINGYIRYDDIISMANINEWIMGALIPGTCNELWYSDKRHAIPTTVDDDNYLFENYILHPLRFQAIKVKTDSCKPALPFKVEIKDRCIASYDPGVEDTSLLQGFDDRTSHWSMSEGGQIEGRFAKYRQSGFFRSIPYTNKDEFKHEIQELKNRLFIREGTRALIIYITTYNANLNRFTQIRFLFEMPPTGGVYPDWSITTVKLLRYVQYRDFFLLGIEMTLVVYTLYFILEEIRELSYFGLGYLQRFWNIFDVAIVILTFYGLAISLFRANSVAKQIDYMISNPQRSHVNLQNLFHWTLIYENILGINVFLCWVKVFKYLAFTPNMDQITNTLSEASAHYIYFSAICLSEFMAFVFWGNLLLGYYLETYSTILNSFFSLLRIFVGDLQIKGIRKADWFLGTIFFTTYIVLFYLIIGSFGLIIFIEAFNKVRTMDEYNENEVTPLGYLGRFYWNVFHGCKQTVKVYRLRDRTKITFEEIRKLLQQSNFSEQEIDMFMAKYGIFKHIAVIEGDYLKNIMDDLEYRDFRPFTPADIISMAIAEEEKENTRIRKRQMAIKKFTGLTTKQFAELQSRLDQIEIQIEVAGERLNEVVRILHQAERDNWARKRE